MIDFETKYRKDVLEITDPKLKANYGIIIICFSRNKEQLLIN